MGVHVNYYLLGAGWAECYVNVNGQSAHLIASYLSDALGDLVRAVADVLGTAKTSEAAFVDEPGEHLWCFERVPPDRLRVRIVWFPDWPTQTDAIPDRVVLDEECRLRSFAGAVLAAAQQVHRDHGEAGYLEQWRNNPFPTELVARLKTLLDQGAGRG